LAFGIYGSSSISNQAVAGVQNEYVGIFFAVLLNDGCPPGNASCWAASTAGLRVTPCIIAVHNGKL
jgi:hypothetical protein